jgi:hypothetical protein
MNESMKTIEEARDSSRNYTKTTGAVSGEGEETWRRAEMDTTPKSESSFKKQETNLVKKTGFVSFFTEHLDVNKLQ